MLFARRHALCPEQELVAVVDSSRQIEIMRCSLQRAQLQYIHISLWMLSSARTHHPEMRYIDLSSRDNSDEIKIVSFRLHPCSNLHRWVKHQTGPSPHCQFDGKGYSVCRWWLSLAYQEPPALSRKAFRLVLCYMLAESDDCYNPLTVTLKSCFLTSSGRASWSGSFIWFRCWAWCLSHYSGCTKEIVRATKDLATLCCIRVTFLKCVAIARRAVWQTSENKASLWKIFPILVCPKTKSDW